MSVDNVISHQPVHGFEGAGPAQDVIQVQPGPRRNSITSQPESETDPYTISTSSSSNPNYVGDSNSYCCYCGCGCDNLVCCCCRCDDAGCYHAFFNRDCGGNCDAFWKSSDECFSCKACCWDTWCLNCKNACPRCEGLNQVICHCQNACFESACCSEHARCCGRCRVCLSIFCQIVLFCCECLG